MSELFEMVRVQTGFCNIAESWVDLDLCRASFQVWFPRVVNLKIWVDERDG